MYVTNVGEVQLYDAGGYPVHWQDGVGAVRDDGLGDVYGPWSVFRDAQGTWYQMEPDYSVVALPNQTPAAPLAPPSPVSGPPLDQLPLPPTRSFELHILNTSTNEEFIFPLTPQKIGPQRPSKMIPFSILDFGDFVFQRGIGPRRMQLSGRMPGNSSRTQRSVSDFRSPQWIIQVFEDSQEKQTVLEVKVPGTPIDYKMQIENLGWSIDPQGGWAGDYLLDTLQLVEVSDRYLQARPADLTSSWPTPDPNDQTAVAQVVGATSTGDATSTAIEDDGTGTRSDPGPDSTYTVKEGDSLWKIAVELWRDGSRWVDLYNANADAINAANGGIGPDLIYPGLVLQVPGADDSQSSDPTQVPVSGDFSLSPS